MTEGSRAVPCVGGLLADASGRLLLVRRANEPGRGRWSLPGGRVEPGESDEQALIREMSEETGLDVRVGALVGRVRVGDFDIADYACEAVGGELRAGDDASDVRWCDAVALTALPLVDDLLPTLTGWGALPRPCADTSAPALVSAHGGSSAREGGQGGGEGRPGWSPPRASP